MNAPRVQRFNTGAALTLQASPATESGFYMVMPATVNVANDTQVNAFHGTAAIAANSIHMSFDIVANQNHPRTKNPYPFVGGLFLQAPNNNINWVVYTWDQTQNFRS